VRTGCAVVSALRLVLGLENGTTELSTSHGGCYLGIPLWFTRGQPLPSLPPLDPFEARQFEAAQSKLRAAYEVVRGIPSQPLPSGRTKS